MFNSQGIVHIVWGTVVGFLILALQITFTTVTNGNIEFDKACIQSGKSIVYETKQGTSGYAKECK